MTKGPFVISAIKSESISEKDTMLTIIILERPYAFLKIQLDRVFEEQSDVIVVIDRRYVERREKRVFYSPDRRKATRRRLQNQIGKVVISV